MPVRSGLPNTNHSVSQANTSTLLKVLAFTSGGSCCAALMRSRPMSLAHCSIRIKPVECLSVDATFWCLAQIGSEGSTPDKTGHFTDGPYTRQSSQFSWNTARSLILEAKGCVSFVFFVYLKNGSFPALKRLIHFFLFLKTFGTFILN